MANGKAWFGALSLHMQGHENSIALPVYTNVKMKAHSHRSAFLLKPFEVVLQICSLAYYLLVTVTRVYINYECSGPVPAHKKRLTA